MVTTRAFILAATLLASARGCGQEPAATPPPGSGEPSGAESYANPYELADVALQALVSGDEEKLARLLGGQVPDETLQGAGDLGATDAVLGLYFIDEGDTIAAVVRRSTAASTGIWLKIVRTEAGFVLQSVVVSDEDPPTDSPVEG